MRQLYTHCVIYNKVVSGHIHTLVHTSGISCKSNGGGGSGGQPSPSWLYSSSVFSIQVQYSCPRFTIQYPRFSVHSCPMFSINSCPRFSILIVPGSVFSRFSLAVFCPVFILGVQYSVFSILVFGTQYSIGHNPINMFNVTNTVNS